MQGRDFWVNLCGVPLLDLTRVAERAAAGVLLAAGLDDAAGARPFLGLQRALALLWFSPSGVPRLVLTPTHPCSGRAQHVDDLVAPGQLQAVAVAVSALLPGCFPSAQLMPVLQSGSALRRRGRSTVRLWLCCRACEFLLSLESGQPAGGARAGWVGGLVVGTAGDGELGYLLGMELGTAGDVAFVCGGLLGWPAVPGLACHSFCLSRCLIMPVPPPPPLCPRLPQGRCHGSELEREDMHPRIHCRLHIACVRRRFTHTELDFIPWPGTVSPQASNALHGLSGAERDAMLISIMDAGPAADPAHGEQDEAAVAAEDAALEQQLQQQQ